MQRNRSFEQYLIVGAILVFFVWVSASVLKPVIFGLFLSLVVYHLFQVLCKKHWPRALAALTLTLALCVCVILPTIYISIVLIQDATALSSKAGDFLSSIDGGTPLLRGILERIWTFVPDQLNVSLDDAYEKIQSSLTQIGATLAVLIGNFAKTLPNLAMEVVFLLLGFYFGLLDGGKLAGAIRDFLPFSRQEVSRFFSTTVDITRGVVIGSLLAGVIQATIICIGYIALGVPRPFFFGVLTIVFSFVPFLGSFPAGVGAVIYLFAMGRPVSAFVMLGLFALASFSDNIVKPLALKGQMEIHPLLGLISVIGGLSAFGILGLFLGPLIAALTLVSIDLLRGGQSSASVI